jgi:hypothetical protein
MPENVMNAVPNRRSLRCLAACLSLGQAAAACAATTYYWPELPIGAVPPCNGSLQACIDGTAAGDTIVIEGAVQSDLVHRYSSVTINEDVFITHALTLLGDPAVDAVFGAGHTITVQSPSAGDVSTTLRHLVLNGGAIFMQDNSPAASTFTVEEIRVHEMLASADCAIDVRSSGAVLQTVNISGSTLDFTRPYASGAQPAAICVLGSSGTLTVNIYNNRVHAFNTSLVGGISQNNVLAGGTAAIYGNSVYGAGFEVGISAGSNPGAAAGTLYVHDNWVSGQTASHFSISAAMAVFPESTDVHVTNNTLVHNVTGLLIYDEGGAAPTGRFANNVIAFNSGRGVVQASTFTGIGNRNNMVYANPINQYTPGPGTLTVDPQLMALDDARLRSTSPAIDAGNNADVPGFSSDADAETRIANGTVDIGAYEYRGQQTIVHTAASNNTVFNYSDVSLNSVDTGSLLLATPHHDDAVSTTEATQNVGVYFSGDVGAPWAVYYENNTVPMTVGRRFSVTNIGFGAARFLHASTLGNDVGAFSQLSNASLPNLNGLVLGVTHNYNPGGVGGTYDDERVGFDFFSGHWYLQNQNGADDFQSGRYFNVLVEPLLTVNAFKATVGSDAIARLQLSHRLLDDNPCAAPQVFRDSTSVVNDTALSVQYVRGTGGAPGHWFVVAEGSGATFPAGAVFNVIVDGAQANACSDDNIFADGFDG